MKRGIDHVYVVIAGVAILIVLTCYAINFYFRLDYGISPKPEDWAALGEFFGGFLGPILTFMSIVLLIKSLRLQNDANKSLRKELSNSEKTERIRSFEALFFGMIEAQRDLFKQFEIEVDIENGSGRGRALRGVEAVLWLEDRVERLREASKHGLEAEGATAVCKLIDEVDVWDQIFGIIRAFYIVVKLIIERLSVEGGFSEDERKSHFLALINFTNYSHLRLVLICVQFTDYASVKYLKESDDFGHALADVGLSFSMY